MNFRTTFVLLLLLLGVGAYVMFTSSRQTAPTMQKTDPQRLLDISSNDVSKVVITPLSGQRIVLERSTQPGTAPTIGPATSDWKLTEPITAYADAMKVSDLIDALVTATSTAQVPAGAGSADYGLDNPQITVDLEAGPKSARVYIGRQVNAGNELYVNVQGKEMAEVVGADLLDKLDTTADKLRLTRLLNADATTANWVNISRRSDPLALEKVAGQWQLSLPTTQPTTMPAEQSAAGDLISSINNMQAVAFGDSSSDANLLIGQPQAMVTVSDQRPTTQPSAQTETIEFGVPDSLVGKNVWVRVTPPGVLATVLKETLDQILKSPLDLRDHNVARIDPALVTEIRIIKTRPPTTQPIALPAITHEVVLVRRPPPKPQPAGPPRPTTGPTTAPVATTQPASVWEVQGNLNPTDADDTKVDALLTNFNPLHADKYLPPAPPTNGMTTYLVTITTHDGEPSQFFFADPGPASTDSPIGMSGDATFTATRAVISALDAGFTKTP